MAKVHVMISRTFYEDDKASPNEFLHYTAKGCELSKAQKQVGMKGLNEPLYLFYQICETHGADVCRCGWQFRHHPVNQK
jgi:hypothetical protein